MKQKNHFLHQNEERNRHHLLVRFASRHEPTRGEEVDTLGEYVVV